MNTYKQLKLHGKSRTKTLNKFFNLIKFTKKKTRKMKFIMSNADPLYNNVQMDLMEQLLHMGKQLQVKLIL